MKSNIRILILAIFLLLTGNTYAQQKKVYAQQQKIETDLVIGTSMPEQYHMGIRIHYIPNARLDFIFGSDLNDDYNGTLYAATVNHAFYFGKVNSKINRELWSVNTGVSFLLEQTVQLKSTSGYLNLFFARELPITKRIFIQPEFGASYFLFEEIVNQDNFAIKGHRIRITPKYGLNLIVKL